MASKTLLEIVQDILNDLDSDEVNSINDTVEAQQIAQIVRTTYENIISGKDWPHLNELFRLDSSGTSTRPSHMALPSSISEVLWVKYNKKKLTDTKDRFEEIKYKTPKDFLGILDLRDSSASNVQVVTDATGVTLNIINDTAPQYYTSFDNSTVVFDAFDSEVDSILQSNKTKCFGKRETAFTVADSFVPDLPNNSFSYLIAEAKSTAFLVLKQAANPKAEQVSNSQRRRMSQEAWRVRKGISYPNFGRK